MVVTQIPAGQKGKVKFTTGVSVSEEFTVRVGNNNVCMRGLLRCFAVGELVVGELLPVSQSGVKVVEDVEISFPSVKTRGESSQN